MRAHGAIGEKRLKVETGRAGTCAAVWDPGDYVENRNDSARLLDGMLVTLSLIHI